MRVANVVHYFLPKHLAGTEVLTYNLSKKLKKDGHQVFLFFSEVDGTGQNLTVKSGFYEDLEFRQVFNNYTHIKDFIDIFLNKKIDSHFANFLDDVQPDIVHFHHLIGLSFGMIDECKRRNIPIVFSLHDYWFMCPQGQRFKDEKEICYEIDPRKCADCMSLNMIGILNTLMNFIKRFVQMRRGDRQSPYDFVKDYFVSKKLKGGENFIGTDSDKFLFMHPDSSLRYKKIKIRNGDRMRFSLSVHPDVRNKIVGLFKFSIFVGRKMIFEKEVDAHDLVNNFSEEDVDFNEFAGKNVDITFITEAVGDVSYGNAAWKYPRILSVMPKGVNCSSKISDTKERVRGVVKFFNRFFIKESIKKIKKRDKLAKEFLKKCDYVIAPTPFLFKEFKKWGLDNLIYSEDGIEDMFFKDFDKKFDKDKLTFAFVGSIIPSKGVLELVKAFNKVKEKNVYLNIYGDPAVRVDYYAKVQAEVKNKNIKFLGTFDKNDISKIYNEFDVLVVPSLWFENGPLVIRNALLSTTPVIASNMPGMNFLVKHNQNGLLFEVGNVKDLFEKMDRIIKNPMLMKEMSQNGKRPKTIEENALEHKVLYEKLIKNTGIKRSSKINYKCSIVIPTYNGGDLFERVIYMITQQDVGFDYEVLIVDSGSKDNTVAIAELYGAKIYKISSKDFNHGLTRNFGISKSRGEIVVLLTQDAVPADQYWLKNIVKEYEDPEVGGVYCKQVPRSDCNIITARNLNNWVVGSKKKIINQLDSTNKLSNSSPFERYVMCNFDDVCSSIRRSVWDKIPFIKMNFAEDLRWGLDCILSGHKIVFTPESQVVHSHNRSIGYDYKRTILTHQKLIQLFDLVTVPSVRTLIKAIPRAMFSDFIYVLGSKVNFFQKIYYIYYIVVTNIFFPFAQYKAAKDTKNGNLKTFKGI